MNKKLLVPDIGDFEKVEVIEILVKKGDKFSALNGNTYELDDNMLVISDDHSVDDLAGIMGGERTGVSEKTKRMFLEAAIFDPVSIANTGRKLILNSIVSGSLSFGISVIAANPAALSAIVPITPP